MFQKLLLVIFFLASLPLNPACAEKLVFGLPSSGSAQAVQRMWEPLLADMSRGLGAAVSPRVFDDYAGVVWALRQGDIQIAWLGNKGAIEAVDRAGAQVGAQVVNKNGMHGYFAHLIARQDSKLNTVHDVIENAAELTFGNGDPNSTSGSLVPGYYIFASRSLEPDRLFQRMTQGGHESNFLAVAAGETDVATSNSADLERLAKRYPEEHKNIKIIWASPLIPSDPILFAAGLDPCTRKRIVSFLSSYGKAAENKPLEQIKHEQDVLQGLTWSGFRPSDNSQLLPVRKLKLFKELEQVKKDPSLSEAQRTGLAAELEQRLRELDSIQ